MRLSEMLDEAWETDPKRFAFTFSRYKFVAKMLSGMDNVLEVGAHDGLVGKVVESHVGNLVLTDKNPKSDRVIKADPIIGITSDIEFDGAYALDVLEHIPQEDESLFLGGIVGVLKASGVCIIGMPSLESQKYASKRSVEGHVNCKTEDELRTLMQAHFRRVFMFGMNDEVLHTGFGPMCHYRMAVGIK